jgi:pimeloyl-ACP methyl ester carboxylesterase
MFDSVEIQPKVALKHRIRRGFLDIEGLQIHYRQADGGNRGDIVILHKCPGSSIEWLEIMEALARNGWKVTAMDLPGLGDSEPFPAPPRVEDYGRIAAAFVEQTATGPAMLVGHHTGAAAGLSAAVQVPDLFKKVLFSGLPVYDSWGKQYEIFSLCNPRVWDETGEIVQAIWQATASRLERSEVPKDLVVEHTRRAVYDIMRAGTYWYVPYVAIGNWTEGPAALASLELPTMILESGGDTLADLTVWQLSLLKNGSAARMNYGAIWPHLAAADEFVRIVHEFFVR